MKPNTLKDANVFVIIQKIYQLQKYQELIQEKKSLHLINQSNSPPPQETLIPSCQISLSSFCSLIIRSQILFIKTRLIFNLFFPQAFLTDVQSLFAIIALHIEVDISLWIDEAQNRI
ncbi:hypothetical protein ABPG72_011656 [Tetrahymena utriculariae]